MDGRKITQDKRPKLLIVYADSVHAATCSRYLRRQGWDVHLSPSGEEARQLAEVLAPAAVVLDVDAPSWQNCARHIHGQGAATIIVVAANAASEQQHRQSLGATAFVQRSDGPQAVAEQLNTASA